MRVSFQRSHPKEETILKLTRTIVLGALVLGAMAVTTIIVHEAGHIVMAGALGVSLIGPPRFDADRLAVALAFEPGSGPVAEAMINYTGGILAGALWLCLYVLLFLRRGFAERGRAWWLLGLAVLMMAVWQIGQGILEGSVHGLYISTAVHAESASFVIQGLFILIGMLLHLQITRFWRRGQRPPP